MKWFYDLKTTYKLMVSFGGAAAMLVVVGFVGLSGILESNAALSVAYERDAQGIDLAAKLNAVRLNVARSYRQGLLVGSSAARETALSEIAGEQREFERVAPELRAILIYKENRDSLDAIVLQFHEYARLSREALVVSATDMPRAHEILERSSPLGQSVGASIERIVEAKRRLAEEAQAEAKERFARSRNAVLATMLVAILLAVASVRIMGRAIAEPLTQAVGILERVAAGDLVGRLEVDSRDEVGQLARALNRSIESVRNTLVGVQDISTQVSSAASQLAASAEEISGGAQAQAASLEETAASLEEISATVKQNADNAQQASQLASGARDSAERGGQVVELAVSAMTEITRSSKKIADIITTIDEIAFQTNLLALNAAVEAARAGEQGRGFGVVAAEVRTLAQRTASAAKEIRGLIADSTSKVEVGTQQVNRSGETLEEIVRSVKRVTDMVSEIAAASREQNTGVDQVNTAVTEVDKVTQGNAAQTEELSATAMSLSEKAGHLEQLVAGFELGAPKRYAAASPPPLPAKRRAPARAHAEREPDSGVHRSIAPRAKAAGGFEEF
jgi:methyl-accepting chemotaxis protein